MAAIASPFLRTLPIGDGPAVVAAFDDLRMLVDGAGPALLPVPASDAARRRILVDALRPDDAPAAPAPAELAPLGDDTALVVATSGSTGTPKGAMLSASALHASAVATENRLAGPGRWLLALPAHHIAGLQVVLRSLLAGAEPHVLDVSAGFDPLSLPGAVRSLEASAGDRPLYTSLIPGQLRKVLNHPSESPAAALARFHTVLLGGAAAEPELLERAAAADIHVVRTYGSSETAGGCVYDGVPLAGTEVEIDDDSRVWLGGPTVAAGYRNAPGHEAFSRRGWFRTEDAGSFADDGALRILGRLDTAVSVGGLTIVPQVVEVALTEHPAISEAVVVGVPDVRLGHRLAAAIVPAPSASAPPPAELSSWVRERLGRHSAPATYDVMGELPVLANGKVDRKEIERRVR